MTDTAIRVALVLGSSTGGIGAHVASLVAGLPDRGIDVTVFAPEATGRQFRFAESGARFVPLEIPATPRASDAPIVFTLRRALHTQPSDVIHAHGLRAGMIASLASRTGGPLAARSGVPLVVTWHNAVLGAGLRGMAYRGIERYVARSATVILGASDDLVQRARVLGASDARSGPVAAPVLPAPARDRATVRAEVGIADGRPVVLSVGRLHPQKGYDTLITAATRWNALQPAPVVLIAGSGPSQAALSAQISADGAPVTLLGHRRDVADLLGAADVAVVSSVWEARQLFVQEALRAGVPLVATAVGGIPGLVGDAAVLVPAGDPGALAAAVSDLLLDPSRRAEYSRRGRERAAGWPTESQTIDQVADLYRELAAGRVPG